MAAPAFRAVADEAAAPARSEKPENHYTGTISSVNPTERVLRVNGVLFSKTFSLGENCTCVFSDQASGTVNDLRPGEKVAVHYQDAQGVLIADRVEQVPMRYTGMVKAINPAARSLTLQVHGTDRTFQVADESAVMLHDNKAGALSDIQVGDHVTVTYETPNDKLTARAIAQTSVEYTGTLKAVDLEAKTLKAKGTFNSKIFNVADNCAILVDGRTNGRLSDLKLNDRLSFKYDEINGVNVVSRIAPAESQPKSVAASKDALTGN